MQLKSGHILLFLLEKCLESGKFKRLENGRIAIGSIHMGNWGTDWDKGWRQCHLILAIQEVSRPTSPFRYRLALSSETPPECESFRESFHISESCIVGWGKALFGDLSRTPLTAAEA